MLAQIHFYRMQYREKECVECGCNLPRFTWCYRGKQRVAGVDDKHTPHFFMCSACQETLQIMARDLPDVYKDEYTLGRLWEVVEDNKHESDILVMVLATYKQEQERG